MLVQTRNFRIVIALFAIASLSCVLFWQWQSKHAASVNHRTMTVDGVERSYRLVVPLRTASIHPRPLVIALHGALDTTDEMAAYTQLDLVAIQKNFILVYPQGRNLNWPPLIPEENPTLAEPDYRFIDSLCEHLVQNQNVDPKRIYVVGVSMGGAMCNLLLANRSERFAAAVCNCGWLPDPLGKTPLNTKNKCPILFITGSEDRQVSPGQVEAARDAFEKVGHPTKLRTIPGFGHGWAVKRGINEEVWTFLEPNHL